MLFLTNVPVWTIVNVYSLTTKKQTTKFSSANFQIMLSPSYIILKIQTLEGKQCTQNEHSHQDLPCLQNQLVSSLVLKDLTYRLLAWYKNLVKTVILDCVESSGNLFTLRSRGLRNRNHSRFQLKMGFLSGVIHIFLFVNP